MLNAFFLTELNYCAIAQAASKAELFLKADQIYYDKQQDEIRAQGNVVIDIGEYILETDSVKYNFPRDMVYADHGVKISGGPYKNIYGEQIIFKNDVQQGVIKNFVARFDKNSIIAAQYAKKLADRYFYLENAVFSPCRTYCSGNALWQIKAEKAIIDYDAQKVIYRNSAFEVYGHRIMYVPYFSHPTPDADSQSGFLVPGIKNKDLLLPIYFRIKPYADLTFSPRISPHYSIFETEYRQKTSNGEFEILANFGNPSDKKLKIYQDIQEQKNIHRDGRFHLKVNGKLTTADLANLGYKIDIASDKSYLANYYNIYDPYLTSEIYGEYAEQRDYFSLKAVGFQELRTDGDSKRSFLTPLINTQHSIALNQDESVIFNIRSNSLVYTNSDSASLLKSSIKAGLHINHILDSGHIFTYDISNRLDIYVSQTIDKPEEITIFNIPSASIQWRYPLIGHFHNKMIQIEPIIKVCGAKDAFQNREKNPNYVLKNYMTELNESNIFHLDKLNIVNNYERNFQASYGINASLSFNEFYIKSFFGQAYYNMTFRGKRYLEQVGNITTNIGENLSIIYRYRGDNNFHPIRQEVEMNASFSKLKTHIEFAKLNNISTYFSDLTLPEKQDKISQLNWGIDYQIAKGLWVGAGIRANISYPKTELLSRNIRMTYIFDCVSISCGWTDNLFEDKARGIRKRRFPNFGLKLKVLNM
ncbi:MAG: LPS-assembly protein LptD [Rickettsiaceae bacterium]|nr:LPS-assembly protein LptD [Rickettsiaceae bacterium]